MSSDLPMQYDSCKCCSLIKVSRDVSSINRTICLGMCSDVRYSYNCEFAVCHVAFYILYARVVHVVGLPYTNTECLCLCGQSGLCVAVCGMCVYVVVVLFAVSWERAAVCAVMWDEAVFSLPDPQSQFKSRAGGHTAPCGNNKGGSSLLGTAEVTLSKSPNP